MGKNSRIAAAAERGRVVVNRSGWPRQGTEGFGLWYLVYIIPAEDVTPVQ
jgi:hypothetical protein